MKHIVAIVGILTLMVTLVVGCTSGSSTKPSSPSTTTTQPSATPSSGAKYEWKLGTSYIDPASKAKFNAFGQTVKLFCELVNQKTKGQVKVTPFYSSLLGGQPQLYQQVRDNEIQVFYGQPLSTIDKRFGFWSVPGVFRDYNMVKDLFTSPDKELYKIANSIIQEHNCSLIGNNIGVFRQYFNSKKPIRVPADVKGLKTRIYEDAICQAYFGGLCAAVIIPASEVTTALQTRVVDGIDHTATYAVSGLTDVCKYGTDINWQWTWGGAIIASNDALKSLPDELRAAVIDAAVEASAKYDQDYPKEEAEAIEGMKKSGIDFYRLNDQERAQWTAYAQTLEPRMRETVGPDFYDKASAIVRAYKKP